MKKINTIIIDDEPKSVSLLSILLQKFHSDVNILGTANAIQPGLDLIEKHRQELHILFLDIQMPGGDGFTLLQQIPAITFRVIFTTAFDQFALKAIKFSALEYLLKPIYNKELAEALDKFRLAENNIVQPGIEDFKYALSQKTLFGKLAVATLHEVKFINLDKINYLESDNNYTSIYIEHTQRLVSSKNIGYYEELLASHDFFRVSNSYLVNLKKIDRFIKGKSGAIELEDGKVLQVSATKKEKLLRLLGLD